MFSSRLNCNFERNPLSVAIEARRQSESELLDLTVSNPTQAGLRYNEREITTFSDERVLVYEPHPQGMPEARQAVSQTYSGRVPPEQIVLTASTSEAYSFLFKLLCDPGDEVLVPRPSYPLFEFLADLESVHIRQYPLFYDAGWSIDFGALEAVVTPRCRAVLLVNPNNPTGSFLKRQEYVELAKLCSRFGMAIISDEVFADFAFDADSRRVPTLTGMHDVLTFSLNGLSKAAGLPQMKLGWIAVTGPETERSEALARLEVIADTFLSVNTPVQWAAPRLLESGASVRDQIRVRTRANLRRLREVLASSACEVLDVEAGWYAILQVPRVRTEEQWAMTLLEESGVLVQPGYFYDFGAEAFLVLSLLTPEAVFAEGASRIGRHV